jgi:predicted dinucleotide-binding enzyme
MAIDAGFDVTIAASGGPEIIALVTQVVIPGAEPRWAADAARDADIVVMAMPLHKFTTFDSALVAGKLVIDAMNYWPAADGRLEMFQDRRYSSSEIVQRQLARSTVVKTLNHIGYQDLEDARRSAGSAERRALGVAGDDAVAVKVVEDLVERIGYDAVRLDSLNAGRVLQPGGPVFGAVLSRSEFELAISAGVA